ncbi:DUF3667 domain-containing protein [Sphingomonas sp.]|uniref:DUF3667 domain-containing protein n=1 Tax=Sphingomonas sp. TaxID=28214 RepID=UPI002EDB7B2B
MTGDMAAAGDAVTGMLAAQAVDGRGGHAGGQAELCLNCGTRLLGAHCHACGQSGHVHRTVGAIGHEIAHGVFHFEGRIWRTLPMLVLRPGQLTRRYIAGERARFVSPLALFLFTVFLMFAAISAVGGELDRTLETSAAERAENDRKIDVELVKARAGLARAQSRTGADREEEVEAQQTVIDALETAKQFSTPITVSTKVDGPAPQGWAALRRNAIQKFKGNPGLMLYKLQSSAYKYSWALIPLSTPFVALLFLWRRRFGLYDHAIFITYSLAFMMLLVIALTLAGAAGLSGGWIALPALLIPPAHMFAQLRGAYGLSTFSALWRTVILLGFAVTILGLYGLGVFAMGMSG